MKAMLIQNSIILLLGGKRAWLSLTKFAMDNSMSWLAMLTYRYSCPLSWGEMSSHSLNGEAVIVRPPGRMGRLLVKLPSAHFWMRSSSKGKLETRWFFLVLVLVLDTRRQCWTRGGGGGSAPVHWEGKLTPFCSWEEHGTCMLGSTPQAAKPSSCPGWGPKKEPGLSHTPFRLVLTNLSLKPLWSLTLKTDPFFVILLLCVFCIAVFNLSAGSHPVSVHHKSVAKFVKSFGGWFSLMEWVI